MKIRISQKVKAYLKTNNYNRICMTRGKSRCVYTFSEDEWNRQKNEFGLIFSERREKEQMTELYFQDPTRIDLESNGYTVINIPDELQEWADIEVGIIIVARSNKIEIWSKENYSSYGTDKSRVVLESLNCKDNKG